MSNHSFVTENATYVVQLSRGKTKKLFILRVLSAIQFDQTIVFVKYY
jgi:hypothetical protein